MSQSHVSALYKIIFAIGTGIAVSTDHVGLSITLAMLWYTVVKAED
jgi:hypothetical protein